MSFLPNDPIPVDLSRVEAGYGDHKVLHGLDLRVESGERVVLLGPNGAGKTTLFRCLLGLVRPHSGHVRLLGQDPSNERLRQNLLLHVGASIEAPGLPAQTRPAEYLEHFARLCGIPDPGRTARAALRLWELPEDTDAQNMSLGQRQRLQVARSLLHAPRLALLDEPAANLDPSAQESFWALLDRWQDATGATLVVSTHHLEEAFRHGSRWVLMGGGRILADGSPRNILAAVRASRRLRLSGPVPGQRLREVLARRPSPIEILGDTGRTDSEWRIVAPAGNAEQAAILKLLLEAGLQVVSYGEDGTTLEEGYRHLLGSHVQEMPVHRIPMPGPDAGIRPRSGRSAAMSSMRLHLACLARERRMLLPLALLVLMLTGSVLFALPADPSSAEANISLLALAALLPAGLAGGLAADIVAGERERRSLETFLCAPASPAALVLGKALAILLPALACSWAAIATVWTALVWRTIAPSTDSVAALAVAFAPGCVVASLAVGTWVSARSRTVRAAAQLSALATIPLVVLAQAVPVLAPAWLPAPAAWLAAGSALALCGAALLAWVLGRTGPEPLLRSAV